jgi:hypothetical protein
VEAEVSNMTNSRQIAWRRRLGSTSSRHPIARRRRAGGAPPSCRMRRWRAVLALAVVVALVGSLSNALARADDSPDLNREYAIKAAYLYQFGRYVQWPEESFADSRAPLVIGVFGPDPFGGILEEIARTKKVDGRPIAIRRMTSMANYGPCHILFVVASANAEEKSKALDALRKSCLLLVGEEPDFIERGGTITFFIAENRVRFEINAERARQDQLKISSKLLSLAKIVGPE